MDILAKQQSSAYGILTRERRIALCFSVIWIVLIFGLQKDNTAWATLIAAAVFHGCFIYRWYRSQKWVRAFTELRDGDAETSLVIEGIKTRLYTYKTSKHGPRYLEAILLIGRNREKYIYILPERVVYNGRVRETVKGACIGRYVELVCYSGTASVKRIAYLSHKELSWE